MTITNDGLCCRALPHPRRRRFAGFGMTATLCLALAGCGLPRSGPMLGEMQDAGEQGAIDLIDATPALARASRVPDKGEFPASFRSAPPVNYDRLKPGDSLRIRIWEHDGLDVFPSGQNGVTDFGDQTLDHAGRISLPYLGSFHAAGLTPAQLHDVIAKRLSGLVLGSDVTVQRSSPGGQMVVAQGDVGKPGAYPITDSMQRLSGLLGLIAPVRTTPEQLVVTVRRGEVSGSARLSKIYQDGQQDIALRPGDLVVVHNMSDRVIVLGAAGQQGTAAVTRQNFTVLDALGSARGLSDSLANPQAVFLLKGSTAAEKKPVIYRFDFTKPQQMALAGRFVVHDGDALYVSDAPFTQVHKLLSVFSSAVAPVQPASTMSQ